LSYAKIKVKNSRIKPNSFLINYDPVSIDKNRGISKASLWVQKSWS